jgi:hypothetical protein
MEGGEDLSEFLDDFLFVHVLSPLHIQTVVPNQSVPI